MPKSLPNHVLVLIPGTYKYTTLYRKGDLEDVIQLWILRWGDHSELSGWAQCNCKSYKKRKAGNQSQTGEIFQLEAQVREIGRCAAGFEDGRRGHEPRNKVAVSRSWEMQGNGFPSRASRSKSKTVSSLKLVQWSWFWTSDLQKRVNLCCFKSLNLS